MARGAAGTVGAGSSRSVTRATRDWRGPDDDDLPGAANGAWGPNGMVGAEGVACDWVVVQAAIVVSATLLPFLTLITSAQHASLNVHNDAPHECGPGAASPGPGQEDD